MTALTSEYIRTTYHTTDSPIKLIDDVNHWAECGVHTVAELGEYLDNEFLHNVGFRGTMTEYDAFMQRTADSEAEAKLLKALNQYHAPKLAEMFPTTTGYNADTDAEQAQQAAYDDIPF